MSYILTDDDCRAILALHRPEKVASSAFKAWTARVIHAVGPSTNIGIEFPCTELQLNVTKTWSVLSTPEGSFNVSRDGQRQPNCPK